MALFARLLPQVPTQIAVLIAGAATVGALFGTPVAAALLFTGIVAAAKGGGSLWDRLFLPVAAAGAGAITMHLLGAPPLAFDLPPYGSPQAIDLLTGSLVACGAVGRSASPRSSRSPSSGAHCTRCATRSSSRSSAGFLLGILGLIGGPITMFKGLEQIGELLQDPGAYDGTQLAVIAGIKILALLVAAGALFRGGRIFPATFIGVALGHARPRADPRNAARSRGRVRRSSASSSSSAATGGSRSSSASPSPPTSRCCRCSA